ncbi:type IV pilus biogenesis protein PilP [Meinhardsimonia xiamenensis]|jgi:type IV pilus biogenesis protein PilP|uniref:Type IV pilus biogenesis protein PilP n=1 Tax=Meinhardsimonia xiamenensis TaxID=990712 RepID=A0A1G9B7E2_9RHOB|nr:hypothetical protein [Meinhardsimonia xiamenensis]PRX35112.1 type IV pilus biogenesis protein PilP [Meinhardsimonia xiamenensis]SDK34785.1 type IV pilus biogenesis protein PilP [Meinhardsimonia xiamenensis]
MTPNFALNLSHEGITLLHRTGAGWMRVGEVAVDAPDLGRQLQMLRRTASELESGGITTALILPDSQILYTEIHAPGPGDAAREAQIREALDGMTPYALDELVFDWAGEGEVVKVAVVARETLEEAESFAVEHRFNPVCFTAAPDPAKFPGEPDFGPTRHAARLRKPAQAAASQVAPAAPAGAGAVPPGSEEPGSTDTAPPPEQAAPVPAVSFSARHRKGGGDRPAATGAGTPPKLSAQARLSVGVSNAHLGQKPPGDEPGASSGTEVSSPSVAAAPGHENGKARDQRPEAALEETTPPAPRLEHARPRLGPVIPAGSGPALSGRSGKAAETTDKPARPGGRTKPRAAAPSRVTPAASATPAPPVSAKGETARPGKQKPSGPKEATRKPRGPAAILAGWRERLFRPAGPDPKEAEALTIFGARGSPQASARDTARTIGIAISATLVVVLLLVAAIALLRRDGGETVAPEGAEAPTLLPAAREETPAAETATVSLPDFDIALSAPPSEEGSGGLVGADEGPPRGGDEGGTPASRLSEAPTPEAEIALETTPPAPAPGGAGAPVVPDAPDGTAGGESRPLDVARLDDRAALDAANPESPDVSSGAVPPASLIQPMSRELAEAHYARTGIWPLDPDPGVSPRGEALDELYIASIDTRIEMLDAYALPEAGLPRSDQRPATPVPPPPPGTSFELDERGLVLATPEGTLTPEGIIVRAGRPVVVPVPRPEGLSGPARVAPDLERLRQVRPVPRPADLVEGNERSRLGGRSLRELAAIRPQLRPDSPQDFAEEDEDEPTALAVAASVVPQARPGDFARIVEEARARLTVAPPAPDVAPPDTPSVPTRASVAREATLEDAINLRRVNLIGVFGTPSNRRALVRLPSGRLVKVKVGDSLDGGRVAAIDDDAIVYVKGGRTLTLRVPSG